VARIRYKFSLAFPLAGSSSRGECDTKAFYGQEWSAYPATQRRAT
jgi:hypothetical protein